MKSISEDDLTEILHRADREAFDNVIKNCQLERATDWILIIFNNWCDWYFDNTNYIYFIDQLIKHGADLNYQEDGLNLLELFISMFDEDMPWLYEQEIIQYLIKKGLSSEYEGIHYLFIKGKVYLYEDHPEMFNLGN